MSARTMHLLIVFISLFDVVASFPNYLLEIPNGFTVPDPCTDGKRSYAAVGHWQRSPHLVPFQFDGSHFNPFERNPFGLDEKGMTNYDIIFKPKCCTILRNEGRGDVLGVNMFSACCGYYNLTEFRRDYETKKEWKSLCLLDSDGDGKTNGQELGDPDCVWVKGEKPKGPAKSHPGIKEEFKNNKTTISRSIRFRVKCSFNENVSFA